jgi:hypothetical protein
MRQHAMEGEQVGAESRSGRRACWEWEQDCGEQRAGSTVLFSCTLFMASTCHFGTRNLTGFAVGRSGAVSFVSLQLRLTAFALRVANS